MSPDAIKRAIIAVAAGDDLAFIWAEPILTSMERFDINTPARAAMFLAQIAHESGGFKWRRELWGPTPAQKRYEPPSDKATELGNTEKGDGFRYRGRGLIQITGRYNYRNAGNDLGLDLEEHPELAEKPETAATIAGWYWHRHGCNGWADNDTEEAFEKVTRIINGGLNGWAHRHKLWAEAKDAIAQD